MPGPDYNPPQQPIPDWMRELFTPKPHRPFFPPDAPKDWPGPERKKEKEPA